jgi:signal transduction histidine kinase
MIAKDERERIAADFHDGPLQAFAALRMRLHVLKRLLATGSPAALAELEEIEQLCDSRLAEMRRFLAMLRGEHAPPPSLVDLVERFRRESGLHVDGQFDQNVPDFLRWMVAEALHNIHKHAHATRVALHVSRDQQAWIATIEDDGDGIPPNTHLRSLEQRAATCGGSVRVERSRVEIRIPA